MTAHTVALDSSLGPITIDGKDVSDMVKGYAFRCHVGNVVLCEITIIAPDWMVERHQLVKALKP